MMSAKKNKNTRRRGKAPKETAAEAYAKLQDDNAALLDLIGQELGAHKEQAAADPKNWGLPGDLSFVREKLTQVLTFLMNADDEAEAERRIEAHLAEMRR